MLTLMMIVRSWATSGCVRGLVFHGVIFVVLLWHGEKALCFISDFGLLCWCVVKIRCSCSTIKCVVLSPPITIWGSQIIFTCHWYIWVGQDWCISVHWEDRLSYHIHMMMPQSIFRKRLSKVYKILLVMFISNQDKMTECVKLSPTYIKWHASATKSMHAL